MLAKFPRLIPATLPLILLAAGVHAEVTAPADHMAEAEHHALAQDDSHAPEMAADEHGQPGPDTVVATVNGEEITLGQMAVLRNAMGEQAAGLAPEALWDLLLDQMTRQTAIAQEGAKHPTARDKAALVLDRRAYFATMALQAYAEIEPTAEEIQALYEETYDDANPTLQYHARHILLETPEAAEAVRKMAEGGRDFAELAAERSTGPTAVNGGDLGWFPAEQMVEPFADAIKAMAPGEVSGPVETQFGWHVIKLEDVRNTDVPQLDEVRDDMATQVRRNRVEGEIKRLTDDAKITRNKDISAQALSHIDLSQE